MTKRPHLLPSTTITKATTTTQTSPTTPPSSNKPSPSISTATPNSSKKSPAYDPSLLKTPGALGTHDDNNLRAALNEQAAEHAGAIAAIQMSHAESEARRTEQVKSLQTNLNNTQSQMLGYKAYYEKAMIALEKTQAELKGARKENEELRSSKKNFEFVKDQALQAENRQLKQLLRQREY
ncbi:hypothetical protein M011DRAFT_489733 [Sporormia fimetaria CBS 119925]|uniref:Uncharacterized protein n=1 Tax=Sporormia fimetaria CBS 119925 TaxID=1340428 RepID=A0A6A6V062_9PLEO|nr:hypothetical protein M011DRAFT_489733 [Sporormia fimetaria CBS 119925]